MLAELSVARRFGPAKWEASVIFKSSRIFVIVIFVSLQWVSIPSRAGDGTPKEAFKKGDLLLVFDHFSESWRLLRFSETADGVDVFKEEGQASHGPFGINDKGEPIVYGKNSETVHIGITGTNPYLFRLARGEVTSVADENYADFASIVAGLGEVLAGGLTLGGTTSYAGYAVEGEAELHGLHSDSDSSMNKIPTRELSVLSSTPAFMEKLDNRKEDLIGHLTGLEKIRDEISKLEGCKASFIKAIQGNAFGGNEPDLRGFGEKYSILECQMDALKDALKNLKPDLACMAFLRAHFHLNDQVPIKVDDLNDWYAELRADLPEGCKLEPLQKWLIVFWDSFRIQAELDELMALKLKMDAWRESENEHVWATVSEEYMSAKIAFLSKLKMAHLIRRAFWQIDATKPVLEKLQELGAVESRIQTALKTVRDKLKDQKFLSEVAETAALAKMLDTAQARKRDIKIEGETLTVFLLRKTVSPESGRIRNSKITIQKYPDFKSVKTSLNLEPKTDFQVGNRSRWSWGAALTMSGLVERKYDTFTIQRIMDGSTDPVDRKVIVLKEESRRSGQIALLANRLFVDPSKNPNVNVSWEIGVLSDGDESGLMTGLAFHISDKVRIGAGYTFQRIEKLVEPLDVVPFLPEGGIDESAIVVHYPADFTPPTEKKYEGDWYVGLSFKLNGINPFKKKE